jgi:hypothetical protein
MRTLLRQGSTLCYVIVGITLKEHAPGSLDRSEINSFVSLDYHTRESYCIVI